jgi:hypothetical protein
MATPSQASHLIAIFEACELRLEIMRVLIDLIEEGCEPLAAEFGLNWGKRQWLGRKDLNPRSPDPESQAVTFQLNPLISEFA